MFLLITFLLVFGLVACSDSESDDVVDVTKEKPGESSDPEKVNLDDKFGLTTEEILNLNLLNSDSDSFSEVKSFELQDGMTVDTVVNSYGNIRLLVYYLSSESYPSGIIVRNSAPGSSTVTENSSELLAKIEVALDNNILDVIDIIHDESEEYALTGFVFNDELKTDLLPTTLSNLTETDFFSSDSNVEFYQKAIEKAGYKGLFETVNKHITDNDANEFDSAHEILKIIEPIRSVLDEVEINYDDIEDVATIYYKGLNDVSSQKYVVPYITTKDQDMSLLLGFEKNGWLFFDEIIFNIDGEIDSLYSLDPKTDTLGGSIIRETEIRDYDEELVGKLIDANEIKMRFTGEKGELDYTLTAIDKEALKVIRTFNGVHHDLSNLLYRFDK